MNGKQVYLLVSLCLITSCSTMKKTILYSGLSGGLAGAAAGYGLSPDIESQGANAAVFGVLGAGISALVGATLFEDDPRNKNLSPMIREKEIEDPNSLELNLGSLNIEANLSKEEVYKTPAKALPKELKGKIKEQFIIKYESKERYLNKGNKTFYIPSFHIYEHSYDEKFSGGLDE